MNKQPTDLKMLLRDPSLLQTRAYVAGVRLFLSTTTETGLAARVNAMLLSEVGRRDWPLRFYSRELLFSVPARRGFVEPDLAPLPSA